MLALHPDKVRVERFARGYAGLVDKRLLDRAFLEGIHSISPNGILGDPAGASASIGTVCLDAVTSLIVQHARARVRDMHEMRATPTRSSDADKSNSSLSQGGTP